jgi:hypothetical protein
MMHTIRRFFTLQGCIALLGVTALLGLSACATVQGTTGSTTSQPGTPPTPTPTPNNSLTTSLPLLQKSIQALSQAQSVHVDMQGHASIQESMNQLPGGGPNAHTTVTLASHSNVLIPKQEEQGRVTVTLTSANAGANTTTLQASEVFAGQHLYVRVGAAKTWQVIDLTPQIQNAAKGLPAAQQLLQQAAQHISVVDHGASMAGQQRLHHLTLTLDQQNAQAIAALLPQPMLKQALGAVMLQQPLTVDLFVDEATALPARIVIAGQGQVNTAAALGTTNQQGNGSGQARTVQASFSLTITLSKYNQHIQIHVPAPSQQAQLGITQP